MKIAGLIILILTWLLVLQLYFSFHNSIKEIELKIENLSKAVELSSNFNSLAYLNFAEPIFSKSASDVNSLLQKYFSQGGVQITQSRYEAIEKIISQARNRIAGTAPPSKETIDMKNRIIDYYGKYLMNIFKMIGLTKSQLETIQREKGEIYLEMEKMRNTQAEIETLFRIISQRYKE